MKTVKVLNINIASVGRNDLKNIIKSFLENNRKEMIGKVNTEFLLRSLENKKFCDVLGSCSVNIADGKGVLWSARYLNLSLTKVPVLRQIQAFYQMIYSGGSLIFFPRYCKQPISDNHPGLDAMYLMLGAACETGKSVYFFGAEPEVLPQAIKKIKEKFPKLKVAGYTNGYDYTDKAVIDDINKTDAKLLIVALGSPKQEYWIKDNFDKLHNISLAVGEGGSLDFVAGSSKRAPVFMQKLGLEWLWRLFTGVNRTGQPGKRPKSRIRRVWNAVPVFIYNVVKFKLANN